MQKDINENGIRVKDGFDKLVDYLKANKIKIAAASSTKLSKVYECLETAKIDTSLFDYILGGDNVSKSKPDPEIYQKACEALGVEPKKTIALEDSNNGVISAHNAGTIVVLIPDMVDNKPAVKSLAYKIVDNMNKVIDLIENYDSMEEKNETKY